MIFFKRSAIIAYTLTMFLSIAFGLVYLCRDSFMPYHAEALGKNWTELTYETQCLFLALMRIVGGGWIAIAVVIAGLIFVSVRSKSIIADTTIFASASILAFITCYSSYIVDVETNGNPPWYCAMIGMVLLFIGFSCSIIYKRNLITGKRSTKKVNCLYSA